MDDFQLERVLPSGGTVVFRHPEDLTGDDLRLVMESVRQAALAAGPENASTKDAIDTIHGTICAIVEEWSIPYQPGRYRHREADAAAGAIEPWPLPALNPSLIGKLHSGDWRTLLAWAGEASQIIMGAEDTPDDAAVPGSPTEPGSG